MITEGRTAYGADCLTLTGPDGATATVLLHGGQVVDWTPPDSRPVLWMPEAPVLQAGKALRGGIPVCWPWFGTSTEPSQPAHGRVRTARWHVVETETAEDGPAVSLAPDVSVLPEGVSYTLTVRLQRHLTWSGAWRRGLIVHTATYNGSEQDFAFSEALHAYFAISDIAAIHIDGFDGAQYWDKLDPATVVPDTATLRLQTGAIRFDGEVDRIYDVRPDTVSIIDPGYDRAIHIEANDTGTTVLWNPWQEKARRLGDLGPDGWRRMVCIEPGNVKPNMVTCLPGTTSRMAMAVMV